VYLRTPMEMKDSPLVKLVFSLLQRAWTRDYKGLYAIIAEVQNGQAVLEDPLSTMIIDYKRIFHIPFVLFGIVGLIGGVGNRNLAGADVEFVGQGV
jgi:hypothetical protein